MGIHRGHKARRWSGWRKKFHLRRFFSSLSANPRWADDLQLCAREALRFLRRDEHGAQFQPVIPTA